MIAEFLKDYFSIIIFLIIALGLSCFFILLNFLVSPKNPDPEKLSAYECGFEPFNDSRMEFDVRFYLVAILFIIFDLEIAPKKKTPIIAQIILSKAIAGEKP